jgi:hypothetical protein
LSRFGLSHFGEIFHSKANLPGISCSTWKAFRSFEISFLASAKCANCFLTNRTRSSRDKLSN